jgi:hypothetical protein
MFGNVPIFVSFHAKDFVYMLRVDGDPIDSLLYAESHSSIPFFDPEVYVAVTKIVG